MGLFEGLPLRGAELIEAWRRDAAYTETPIRAMSPQQDLTESLNKEIAGAILISIGLPALVVARATLGSINHTLLTLDCLRSRGVPVLGLVFNHPTPPPAEPDVTETVPTILRLSDLRSLGELPYCAGLPAAWSQHQGQFAGRLNVEGLLETLGLYGVA